MAAERKSHTLTLEEELSTVKSAAEKMDKQFLKLAAPTALENYMSISTCQSIIPEDKENRSTNEPALSKRQKSRNGEIKKPKRPKKPSNLIAPPPPRTN